MKIEKRVSTHALQAEVASINLPAGFPHVIKIQYYFHHRALRATTTKAITARNLISPSTDRCPMGCEQVRAQDGSGRAMPAV